MKCYVHFLLCKANHMFYYFSVITLFQAELCSPLSDTTTRQTRRGLSYQLLGEPRGSPLVRDGVERGVLPRDDGVGDDHAVPLVDANAVAPLHAGGERGVLGARQQPPDLPIVLRVRAQAVILLAAFARLADFPAGDERDRPYGVSWATAGTRARDGSATGHQPLPKVKHTELMAQEKRL